MENREKKNSSFKTIISLVICFMLAFILWIYIMSVESPDFTDTFDGIKVQVDNEQILKNNYGLSVLKTDVTDVSLTLKGKKSTLDNITSDDIKAFVDVSSVSEPGWYNLSLIFDLPENVSVEKSDSDSYSVNIFVDQLSSVSLPVIINKGTLDLRQPYELGTETLDYTSITVEGPSSKINNLKNAQVNVDYSGKTSSFVSVCPILLIDNDGKEIDNYSDFKLSVSEIHVNVPIYINKIIPVECVFKYGFLNDSNAKVSVTPAEISIKCDETKYKDDLTVPVTINEKMITGSTYSIITAPELGSDYIVDPNCLIEISVILDDSLETKKYQVSSFNIENASEINYEIADKSLEIILRGTKSELEKIKSSDISVSCDLSEFGENTNVNTKVPVIVSVNSKSNSVFEIGEYFLNVNITPK